MTRRGSQTRATCLWNIVLSSSGLLSACRMLVFFLLHQSLYIMYHGDIVVHNTHKYMMYSTGNVLCPLYYRYSLVSSPVHDD